jgi:hypothetical protein
MAAFVVTVTYAEANKKSSDALKFEDLGLGTGDTIPATACVVSMMREQ